MPRRLYLTLCACLCTLGICQSQSPFTETPVDTLAYTDCSAQLNCSVSDLNATISWSVRVDGRYQQISLGDETYDPRYNITGDPVRGEFHLYMEVTNKNMESSYECRKNQTNLNSTANLFVLDRGPSCDVQPGTDVIENVDTAIFNCSIDLPDDAPGEVLWMRNDQEVARTGNKTNIYMKTFNRGESGDVFTCFYEAPNTSFCHGLQSLNCGKNFTMNVQYPPSVNILDSNNAVIEGDAYNRSCSVDANPNATIQWVHRGSDIGNSEVLHLQNVQRDQSGTYTCQANNTFWDGRSGNGSDTFDLDVQYLFESPFTEIPVDTLAYTSCSSQLNCSVSDLNATISWSVRVDGRYQQISLGDETYDPRYNITGDPVRGEFHLYMQVVNKSMESSYECRENQTNLNTTANLFVLDRGPSCDVQPGTNVIENVDTAIFNCSIDLPGDAPGEVVWMRNDQEVARTGNKTIIYIKAFNRSESGDVFTCFYEAPNTSFCHGLQSLHCGKNFTMNVQYPPGVRILGSNNSVIEGDVYNRSCSVDANPNATVQWIHRGWDVGNSEILHLQNVQRDQNGTYTCQANNTFWDGSSGNGSATFDLDVQYYPELETEISGAASDAGQVITGKDITVVCKVTDSNPDVDTIHWNEASSGELLEFVPVSRDDHGWYMCDASNTFWNGKTGFANVNVSIDVQYPPQVSLEVSNDAVVENNPYSRKCNVDSNPAASVQWEYEDEVIIESNTLSLTNVHRDQHGTYTCRATNTFWDNDSESDSVSFELDVQYHPDVDIGEHRYLVVTTVEGRTYTEDCTVDANPTATVKWKLGSSVVSNTSLLYLTDVSRVQSGRYECVGTNWLFDGSQGSDSQYFTLNVQYPPTVSTEKRAEIVVGRSLTLSCSVASGNPANANIHWILLNGDRQPGSTLPLTDVTRVMAGNYTCEATNTFYDNTQGVGRSTTYLDVHFEPTVQRSHFSDEVEADIGVNATLVCVMSASPSPTFVWQKDGQQITTSSEETIEGTETTSKLIVAFVTKEDYGDYVSTATNYVSEDQCRIKLVGRRGVSAGGITGIVFGLLIVIGVALALGYYWYRRRKYSPEQTEEQGTSLGSELKHIGKDNEEERGHYQDLEFTESEKESNYTSLESQYTSLRQPPTDTADIYMKLGARSNDFPRQHIKMHELIGTGSYGQINRATATEIAGKSGKTVVAVKSVKDSASDDDKRRLTVELNILQRIEPHRNIVLLLGCCTDKEPVYVIMEFMGQGNLLKYLRDYRRDKTSDYANAARLKLVLKSKDLVSLGKQIAAGMQYLASKSFVHGELAAKTVLLSKDRRTCKLSNIGLRGDVEIEAIRVKEHHTRQPIRWFSPETVSSGEYSTMSDAWSFGVVLWEITTLGKTPYPTAKNVTKVREFISKGFRMKRPAYCDAKLYSVMTRCWSENKTERPSFSKLVIELEGMAKSSEVFIDVKKACADTPDYKKAANEKCYETK